MRKYLWGLYVLGHHYEHGLAPLDSLVTSLVPFLTFPVSRAASTIS